jgi:iron complex outermembrane receptor protein/vitamin B12 transporter
VLLLAAFLARPAAAQQAVVTGVVTDPVGARVAAAIVTLAGEQAQGRETRTNAEGVYTFDDVAPGRYQVVATAPGFDVVTSDSFYAGGGRRPFVELTLHVGPLRQAVVVTAAASAVPQSQTGAPITVIDSATLDILNTPDVLEALRLVPGAQVVQVGARGGTTSMFIRGGDASFNKVLIDGVAANDIGGSFDFAQLSTTGVEQIEVLRQTNSVVYGSDALAGVISIRTRRGHTRAPELTLSADGGNLGTWSSGASVGGVFQRLDYYSAYSRFETDNDLPNNTYTNGTFAGRLGVALGGSTDLSATIRHSDATFGSPGGFALYRVADDSVQDTAMTYGGVTAESQFTDRLQTTVRFGSTAQTLSFLNPAPTGTPYDPFGFGANYVGEPVTLIGHNGYTVSGRAILDFSGTYPSLFERRTTRRALSGQTTFHVNNSLSIAGGARYEREQGFADPDDDPSATRNNSGAFAEVRATLLNRTHVSGGLGVEHNASFGRAVTPRLSIASYLRQPSSGTWGETKIVLNAGSGIKAPSVFQEQSSIYALVSGTPAGAGIEPIGPERSRSFDIGVEQSVAASRARIRAAYFHNDFHDLIEFLSKNTLPRVGVPVDVANATDFGAYVNSQSYRAQGVELAADAALVDRLLVIASYTFLDAEVTEAFSATTSFNPAFPDIAIGAFSPLVGERPFRRPVHSGTLMIAYAAGPTDVAIAASFAGARDDSTFLSDQDFGNSLLLPNRNLEAPYQKVDLSAASTVHRRLRLYTSIENLLNQDYEASFGFPALPLTVRVGFKLTVGGD